MYPSTPIEKIFCKTAVLGFIALLVLLCASVSLPGTVHAQATTWMVSGNLQPPELNEVAQRYGEKDYIFPTQEEIYLREKMAEAPATECLDCSQMVEYRAFDGKQYTLSQFQGKNVRLLLPDSWINGLTVDERRTFLDRSDLLCEHFKELTGAEPPGSGLLTIALVTSTCGWGCGYMGYKGIEIADDSGSLAALKNELSYGFTPGVLVHEMTHNFDLFWDYLDYLPDHAHAWTDFMNHYILVYGREGRMDLSPETYLSNMIAQNYLPYYQDATATWQTCVRDGSCEDRGIRANYSWGGILLRFSQLHGPEAVRGYLSFLRNYKQSHPSPSGAEAREDLNVEAMAAGAQLNLGCYVDEWRWYASAALRSRMTQQYGSDNPFCIDSDGDDFSILSGDCDDNDPAINPDAPEIANGKDDNCDGIIDNLLFTEPDPGDFPDPQPVSYPAVIKGRITDGDGDYFTFNLPTARKVNFRVCSISDFQGWLFLYKQDGSWFDYQWTAQGQCSLRTYDLNEARTWRFGVELNTASLPGKYSVEFFDAVPWPSPWGTVEIAEYLPRGYRFATATQNLSQVFAAPTEIRYWVSGFGFIGAVPYASETSSDWVPPEDLVKGTYGVRAQLFAGTTPVADATTPAWFTAVAPALAGNFGAQGLWLYRNLAWSQLTSVSPDRMAGYGNKLAANFPSYGLYQYDGVAWTLLTSNSGAVNLLGVANKLVMDFGGAGLWQYDGAWTQLSVASPEKIAANGNNLLATFPGYGLYQYDGTTWTQLTSADGVDSMLAVSGKVYVDFGNLGLWQYDGGWANLAAANPDKIQVDNGRLVANFPGYGLYEYDGSSWTQLTANDSVQDLLGVAGNLYADFGALGLYRYNGAWTQVSTADANRLGSYGDKLVANFPAYGLYEYGGSGWTLLTGNSGVTDMVAVDLP